MIEVLKIQPNREFLLGSVEALSDIQPLLSLSLTVGSPEIIVDFDFSGVIQTNGSYLRGTFFWSFSCGREAAASSIRQSPASDPFSVRPYPIYPVLTNCNDAVLEEIGEFLNQRAIPAIVVLRGKLPEIHEAMILGALDQNLSTTLRLLAELGESTAGDLSAHSNEKITVNAWSNRLSDLFALRLVRRRREGKFWFYKSISKSHTLWA